MDIILKYFPDLTDAQIAMFEQLGDLYAEWNNKINVISRKDIENLYERHVLHSLGIAKYYEFDEGERILDIGTGGGFPGIPLAILFPNTDFMLVDSIAKKIKVVEEVSTAIGLKNVTAQQLRAEKAPGTYHFAVTRAVAPIKTLYHWSKRKIAPSAYGQQVKNGLICLKGGDLKDEFMDFKRHTKFHDLSEVFDEEFFATKKVVYVPN